MDKKYSIKKVYTSVILVGATVIVGFFSYIWFRQQNDFLSYQIFEFKKRLIANENNLIKQEVENVVYNIRYESKITKELLKKELVKRIDRAVSIVNSLVTTYKGKISDDELKEVIKTSLRNIRFDNNDEYFFIADLNGNEILYPIKPEYENTNIINLKDNKGDFIIKDEINLLKKQNEGFITAYWIKDKNDKREYLKVSYIKKLSIFNWYIGTGIYLDDFEKNLKRKLLLKLSKKKFSRYGYIYVNTYDGYSLLLNGKVNKKPIYFMNNKDVKGTFTTKMQIKTVKNDGAGFINYYWNKIGETKPIKKTAYVKGMDDWKWIIGAGYYHDEINKIIEKAKKDFSNKFYRELIVFVSVILFLLLLLLIFIFVINHFLSKSFNIFIKSFKTASLKNELIKEDNIKFKEFSDLVKSTNSIIRKKKDLEYEIFKKRRLDSLGVLAGGIAHDFNNLLTAIIANINIAKEYNDIDKIKEILSDAEIASDRAKGLALQLLTFSKGGEPILKVLKLPKFVKTTTEFLLSGTNIGIEYDFHEYLWKINADKGQLGQVLENIIINAKQAMPKNGRIKISLKNEALTSYNNTEKFVKIDITDNGVGINKKNIRKIFDPYFTTKESGNGLGLASVYSIVQKHKGIISVNSEVDKGTTFTIYLPAVEKQVEKEEDSNIKFTVSEKNILIMDDEEIILNVSRKLFKHIGYKVTTVKTGEELLLEYKKNVRYDVVIMDLTIHGGMGGEEAIKELLKIDARARVIVSSGYSNSPVMANYKEYGFKGCLIKPYKLEDIKKVLYDLNHIL